MDREQRKTALPMLRRTLEFVRRGIGMAEENRAKSLRRIEPQVKQTQKSGGESFNAC